MSPALIASPSFLHHLTIVPSVMVGDNEGILTSMRSVIAKRLSQSKSSSPHGYSTTECNIDAINAIRNDLKAVGVKISLNDLIIKAAATTLQLVPEVNINTVG